MDKIPKLIGDWWDNAMDPFIEKSKIIYTQLQTKKGELITKEQELVQNRRELEARQSEVEGKEAELAQVTSTLAELREKIEAIDYQTLSSLAQGSARYALKLANNQHINMNIGVFISTSNMSVYDPLQDEVITNNLISAIQAFIQAYNIEFQSQGKENRYKNIATDVVDELLPSQENSLALMSGIILNEEVFTELVNNSLINEESRKILRYILNGLIEKLVFSFKELLDRINIRFENTVVSENTMEE